MKRRLGQSEEKQFKCFQCGNDYSTKSVLKKHVQICTKVVLDEIFRSDLLLAIKSGNNDAVATMCEEKDKHGHSLANLSLSPMEDPDAATYLPCIQRLSPLFAAVRYGKTAVIPTLLAYGAVFIVEAIQLPRMMDALNPLLTNAVKPSFADQFLIRTTWENFMIQVNLVLRKRNICRPLRKFICDFVAKPIFCR